MPKSDNDVDEVKLEDSDVDKKTDDVKSSFENDSVDNAITAYRKLFDVKDVEITEKQQAEIDQVCEVMRKREIIYKETEHEPEEITSNDNKIITGPPMLTRFEKARIMGARALQLSLGAPPFISVPKDTSTSLEIAMEELNERLIPIVIRRVLPNGDYQNIPINHFK
ncbi:MAG TPA: DNA-directed RNA polymerase subunit K [Candidatus Nitrosopelagicus sp.]|jgi:DNA-directed RNA polymerase I, II, and III subunit RPABC2|nr:DNA-directed RNA polymerase subunit K [Candidatus Nitrosopelagicus sp.]|tara:strand:- start:58 stop:558 length:501 start_codon:yes stop_codon:yes gene_type:complete